MKGPLGCGSKDSKWNLGREENGEKGEPGTKDISAGDTNKQVTHSSSWESGLRTPDSTSGPGRSALSLHSVPGWAAESQALKDECSYLF